MSAIYLLNKFSQEAIVVELFLISLVTMSYFGYLLIKKRRYGAAKNQIPDNVVRAYLMELISHAEGFKNQLFGTTFKISPGAGMNMPAATAAPVAASGADGAAVAAAQAQAAQLQQQLAAAAAKNDELGKAIAQLSTEKAALQAKGAASSGGADAGGSKEMSEKISKLEAKLSEYEVIEDDLANLKKYQQENKQLRAQLGALQGGAPAPAADAPAAAAAPAPEAAAATAAAAPAPAAQAAPAASPIAQAEAAVAETKANDQFEKLVDKVEENLAAPAPAPTPVAASAPTGASVADPAAASAPAPAPAAAAATEATNVQPASLTGGPKSDKSDTDLLSEFERMLSG